MTEMVQISKILVADAEKSSQLHDSNFDEKANMTVDTEHKGEFSEEQRPKQNHKERFRRMIRQRKPVIHAFIWMLVTTQVSPQVHLSTC